MYCSDKGKHMNLLGLLSFLCGKNIQDPPSLFEICDIFSNCYVSICNGLGGII